MRAKAFASRLGVSVSTVDNYVRRGIVRPRRDRFGYRHFSEKDVERVMHWLFGEDAGAERGLEGTDNHTIRRTEDRTDGDT